MSSDKSTLDQIFGDKTCSDSTGTKLVHYYGLALGVVVVVALLSGMRDGIAKYILVFVAVVVLERILASWKQTHPVC